MQETTEQAAAGPVYPLRSSGKKKTSDSQAAVKVRKYDSESEMKNMSFKLGMQEERAETSTGGLRCAACQGTGAVMPYSHKSVGGVREHNLADKYR